MGGNRTAIRYGGSSLGLSTGQLNSDYAYADGTMNQVEKFKSLGLFDTPPKDIPGYPDPAGTGTVDERARSYLRTNCAICHRPGGQGAGASDMRFITTFADSKMCDQVERDVGQRDVLFQRRPTAAPFRQALAEHQRGIAEAQQILVKMSELVVVHGPGRLRCA